LICKLGNPSERQKVENCDVKVIIIILLNIENIQSNTPCVKCFATQLTAHGPKAATTL